MSFLEQVERARAFLERNNRVSLRGLMSEFELDQDGLDELIEELVDVQQVAVRQGKLLSWIGVPPPETPDTQTAPAAAVAPTEGERRQLTVMFCDLVGSTALSERLDAEDLSEVMRAYQESASEAISRYQGHIAQYLGDGLLVYFGYPQAYEDSAERAVRAGRELLGAIGTLNETLGPERGIQLAVRLGIHTGSVVVGEMGSGERRETLALGATTNIAARLQGVAEPGSVVISDTTQRLVAGTFRVQDLGTPSLKGIATPVRAYKVLRATNVRSRLDLEPHRLIPLAGRNQEVGLLLDRWKRARRREGQAVLISGEAGLGKSRLLHALRERLADEPHSRLECHCTPYTQASGFHPLIELIEHGVGFDEGEAPQEKLRRLEEAVERAGLSVPELLPLFASLLSLPLPDRYPATPYAPELQRRKTIEALSAWTLAVAEGQPLLMVIEDLHWSDPSTLEFLALLLEQSATAPVLALLSFRPEFVPPWPAHSHVTSLEVGRLGRREAEHLISGMTRDRALPKEALERIVERADGVPIFLEELTKMMLESGFVEEREGRYQLTREFSELAIPATLQDSLMARLDRLDGGKDVAQLGAVLGRRFPYELLRAVSQMQDAELASGLQRLVESELVHESGAPPDSTYTFKHALIQDTAYQSLLRRTRREVHARTAQALAEQFQERAASEPEIVARHYDEAEMGEQAITYYRRAAMRAKRQSANEEAVAQLRRALEILAKLPESSDRDRQELDLQLAIGVPLYITRGWANSEYRQSLERARELATQLGDTSQLFNVWMGLYLHHQIAGELTTAEACARRALPIADEATDRRPHLIVRASLSQTLYLQGHFASALEYLEQAIAVYDRHDQEDTAIRTGPEQTAPSSARSKAHGGRHEQLLYQVHALCLWALGYPDRALDLSGSALTLARQEGHPFNVASAYIYWGWICQRRGQREEALSAAEQATTLCERLGFSWLPWAITLRGSVRIQSAERELAVAEMEEGIASLKAAGTRGFVPHCFSVLAEVLWKLERYDGALGVIEQGLALAEATGQHYEDAELLRLRGEILFSSDPGDVAEAEQAFGQALEIAKGQEARSLELRAAMSLARLWHREGNTAQARSLLGPVHAWFTEGFDTQDWQDAREMLEELV